MSQTAFFGADVPTPAAELPSVSSGLSWYDVQRQRLRKFAAQFMESAPAAVATLRSQGEPDTSIPEVVASRQGFTQLRRDLPVVDQWFEYAGETAALLWIREVALAWVRTNQPDGKPINETNFGPFLRVLKRRYADFTTNGQHDIDAWLARLRSAKEGWAFPQLEGEGVNRYGNHHTHHFRVLLAVYDLQGDMGAYNALLSAIDTHAAVNFPDGSAVTYPVASAIVGASPAGPQFDITGDRTAVFTAGLAFTVAGNSAGNDGAYTTASSSYLSGSDKTRIVTVEPVPASGGGGSLSEHFSDAHHDMPRAATGAGESIDYIRRDALHYQNFNLDPWIEIALIEGGSRYQATIEAGWAFLKAKLLSPVKHYEFAASTDPFDAARWAASHTDFLAPQAMWQPEEIAKPACAYHHWQRRRDPGYLESAQDMMLIGRAVPDLASAWGEYFRWALGYGQ